MQRRGESIRVVQWMSVGRGGLEGIQTNNFLEEEEVGEDEESGQ